MRKWATPIAVIGLLLCLIVLRPVAAQETQYDILYATVDADETIFQIRIVNAESGKITDVATVGKYYGSDAGWSPDGHFIYLINSAHPEARTLTLMNLSDASRQVITDHLPPDMCTGTPLWWSPDSHYLAYLTGNNQQNTLNIRNIRGGTVQVLPDSLDSNIYIYWSSDGRYVVYGPVASNDEQSMVIWDAQGGEEISRVNGDALNIPVWSPTDDRIAYLSGRSDGNITILNARNGTEQKYTGESIDSWSPDGRYLMVNDTGLIDTAEKSEHKLDSNSSIGQFIWSPDSRYLAYETADGQQNTMGYAALYDLSDGSQRRLSDDLISGFDMKWSPTGHWLAVPQAISGYTMNGLQIYDIDGQKSHLFDVQILVPYPYPLEWSPDGLNLTILTEQGVGVFNRQTWKLGYVDRTQTSYSPYWSNDGHYLSYMGGSGDFSDVYVMNLQDFQTYNLTHSPDENKHFIGWRGSTERESLLDNCGGET